MHSRMTGRRRAGALLAALALFSVALVTATSSGAAPSVRGFDGKTITVAGLGIKGQLPGGEFGARARIQRFNDTNEIKGIKIKYEELADDKQDPATALSEARRLVSQVGVFAVVGDISANNPGQYFAQQHVPYFGGGFDNTYCSPKPSTSLWGFSSGGCIVPAKPSFISDIYGAMYKYVSQKTGKKHPTFIVFGTDNASGRNGNRIFAIAAKGAGFKVVGIQNKYPSPPVNDYTPYAQAVLTGDHGSPPDSTFCTGALDCLDMWKVMKAQGYKGIYVHGLYTDQLVKPFDGTAVNGPYTSPSEDTPGVRQLKADLEAWKSGTPVELGAIFGYTSTDMFIQALKGVAKKGKNNITPDNVRKYASTMTWQIKGLMGPEEYPKSTVVTYPACFTIVASDGTAWSTAVPFSCSRKTFAPKDVKVG